MAPLSTNLLTIFQNLQLVKTPLIIFSTFILLFPFLTLLNFPLISNYIQSTPKSTLNSHFPSQTNYVSSHNTSSSLNSNSSIESGSILLLANPPTGSLSKKNPSLVIIQSPSLPQKNGSTLGKRRKSYCDIFDGRWVLDDSGPIYTPGSCPYADRTFNCFKNGRTDVDYLRYRWQPHGCNIPRFDSKRMMEMLRGKRLVFVGDSLNRNMWQSLVCQLKMFKISGKRLNKHKGPYTYHFKDYNSSITYVGAPFLVQRWQHPASSRSTKTQVETLRLDTIEDHAFKYYDADFLFFNTAHWWNHHKAKNGENFFQEGDVVHSKMDVGKAYIKALNTWAKWVDKKVNPNKTQVFFLGFTAIHFKGGQWNSGGSCQGETKPITDVNLLKPYPSMMRSLESVISRMNTPVVYLNITKMTDYRKDAHPSIYRKSKPKSQHNNNRIQDCSHWCLPGVPDSWNQLLYTLLVSSKSVKEKGAK